MTIPSNQTPHQDASRGWWGVLRSQRFLKLDVGLWGLAVVAAALAGLVWGFVYFVPLSPSPAVAPWATSDQVGPVSPDAAAEEILQTGRKVRRALDGVIVSPEAAEPDRWAVVVDNMVEARPATGLSQASVIIEAPAEGGITRLLAIFAADATLPKVGPVRSARPYFLDWAEEYGALFVHVGGSPEALERLEVSDLRDANEFSAGAYFWRDEVRKAPHNAYTSDVLLKRLVERRYSERRPATLSPWKFAKLLVGGDTGPSAAPEGNVTPPAVVIDQSTPPYRVRWEYDGTAGDYRRYQGGKAQVDGDNVLLARNVIVQFVKVRILDEVGRRRIVTVGSGDAIVFSGGVANRGTWEKKSLRERTRFYDVAGGEVALHPGLTWIQAVPVGTIIEY